MKTLLTITAAALLAGAPVALAQSQTTVAPLKQAPAETPAAAPSKVDTATFVKTVPGANAFEIESSKLAETQGSAADVKEFAAMMIKDHTKAGEDFKAALSQGQTTSAVAPADSGLPPKEQNMLDELKAAKGDDFDKKYIQMQTQAHKEAVALFRPMPIPATTRR